MIRDFPEVVAKAKKSSSMKGNRIALTANELMEILDKANRQTSDHQHLEPQSLIRNLGFYGLAVPGEGVAGIQLFGSLP